MGRYEVSDEKKDAHDNVLSDRDNTGAKHLEGLNFIVDRGVEINVIGTNSGGNAKLEDFGR
jgi:hypothetical protein